ncbi:hypothetical protein SRRS_25180 [Sporomusa rhizae]|uniref:DUF167 domain-containing protein n=1 Tax=Sporomusa rhizae TaxID=357999 RepID=UPI00352BBDEE
MLSALSSLDIKEVSNGIAFRVRVQPRSSKNTISGLMGDMLKINLTSPPVDGEANTACIAFFANLLSVSKSQVTITTGQKNRSKIIKITGMDKDDFLRVLASYI